MMGPAEIAQQVQAEAEEAKEEVGTRYHLLTLGSRLRLHANTDHEALTAAHGCLQGFRPGDPARIIKQTDTILWEGLTV